MNKSESIVPEVIRQYSIQEEYSNTVAQIDDLRGQLYDTLTFRERDDLPEDLKSEIKEKLSEQRRRLDLLFPIIMNNDEYRYLFMKMLDMITPEYRDLL